MFKLKQEGEKQEGGGRQYTITRGKKRASVCDCSKKTAESSRETKSDGKKKKTKHKINKNEATLRERIMLILGY